MRLPRALLTLALALPLALGACGGDDDGDPFASGGTHIDAPGDATAVAVDDGIAYVGLGTSGQVAKVDPAARTTRPAVRVTKPGNLISDIAVGGGYVWVPDNEDERLVQVSQADDARVRSRPIGHTINDVVYSEDGVWTVGAGQATRVDPRTGHVGIDVVGQATSEEIAVEGGTVWLPGTRDDGLVDRIAARTSDLDPRPLHIGTQPDPVGSHGGFVWIGDEQEEVLRKVDARTGRVVGDPIRIGAFPTKVVASGAGVFVLSSADRITRIDPDSGEIVGTRTIGGEVTDIAADDTQLFIAAGSSGLTRVPLG